MIPIENRKHVAATEFGAVFELLSDLAHSAKKSQQFIVDYSGVNNNQHGVKARLKVRARMLRKMVDRIDAELG